MMSVQLLCLRFVQDEKVQVMAFYRGFSGFNPQPHWRCRRCALLGPRRDSIIASIDREFITKHGPELVEIEPHLIEWLASAAVNNAKLKRTLFMTREFSLKHPELVSVIFSNQVDFYQFTRPKRTLILAKYVIATIGTSSEIERVCTQADDHVFRQFASVFCNEHVFEADYEECALILLQRAEHCQSKYLGKLTLEGDVAVNIFSRQILPRLHQLPVVIAIDLQVLLKAVREDRFFIAIKENPQILQKVCYDQLELADMLLMPSKRVAELCELHPAFHLPLERA